MPAMVMEHEEDPRKEIFDTLGNLKDVDIFNNQVLVAIYKRGGISDQDRKTTGGIIIPGKVTSDDRFQSKVGVIVKTGDRAFDDDTGVWFKGVKFNIGDLVVFRASDGWEISIHKVPCRLLDDTAIRARIQHPDTVW